MLIPHSILLELTRRYCEPHRQYHTIRHIADMLWRGRELHLDDHQVMAIWYHDAIYDVPSRDNERRSAELAQAQLAAAGWPPDSVETVSRIILDTESHKASIDASRLVIDLDLASLADDWHRFAANTDALRAECAHLDDEQFLAGQRAFFERILVRESIYQSPWGQSLESAARANIERLLAE